MTCTYQTLLDKLLSVNIHGGIKLGLENVLRLSTVLGDPHLAFPSVHVAGTNGKGSVTTKIAAAYQASGLKVGLYTSPHIACFRERIRINNEMITEKQVVKHLNRIFPLIEQHQIPATFFELTTLLAFAHFAAEKVDIAIIETGLGGRLDATNIIIPKLSVITSISLEHTEYLGSTLDLITAEKGGIIKPGVPVVIGPHVPYAVIEEIAALQKSVCTRVMGEFVDYHAENNAVAEKALALLGVDPIAIESGLKAIPCCRLEIIRAEKTTIILDAAHNPEGLRSMLHAINHRFPHQRLRVVIGLSSNKDIEGCLKNLKDHVVHFHLVEANSSRAIATAAMRDALLQLEVDPERMTIEQTIPEALSSALKLAEKKQEIVVVCGTFFILNEARLALGINDPQDPYSLNERVKTS
ncbi:MAG: cyanophycin synthetase [Parachlamydiaceae bacterium]